MPTSPRGVCRRSVYPVGIRADEGIGPYEKNMRFQRRGRCPHRPAGYVDRAAGKNGHAHTIGIRADEGIGPYEKQRAFSA